MTAPSSAPNEIWDAILENTDLRPIVPSEIDNTALYSWNAQRLDLVRKTFREYLAKELHPHSNLKAGVLCGLRDLFMSLDARGKPSATNTIRPDHGSLYNYQNHDRLKAFKMSKHNDLTTLSLPLLETADDGRLSSTAEWELTLLSIKMIRGRTIEASDWSGLLPSLQWIALDKRITDREAPTTEMRWSNRNRQFLEILGLAAELANSKIGCGVAVNLGRTNALESQAEVTTPQKLTWISQSLDTPCWDMRTSLPIDHVFSLDLTTRSIDYEIAPEDAADWDKYLKNELETLLYRQQDIMTVAAKRSGKPSSSRIHPWVDPTDDVAVQMLERLRTNTAETVNSLNSMQDPGMSFHITMGTQQIYQLDYDVQTSPPNPKSPLSTWSTMLDAIKEAFRG